MVLLRTDTLRDILASTTRYHSINPPSSAPDALNSIDLSDIPTITFTHSVAHLAESLRENGISTPIYQSTMKHVSEVALAYRGSFDNCCRTLLAKPQAKDDQFVLDTINNFRQTLQVRFENHDFPSMLSKAIDAQKNLDSHSQSPAEHKPLEARERKPFNHNFTPYLEAYLQQNAFPSSLDQKMLAEKGNMDREQIITWFQNHRSRARKDGKEADLKRLPAGQVVNLKLIDENVRTRPDDIIDYIDSRESDNIHQESLSSASALFNLDELAISSDDSIPKSCKRVTPVVCTASSGAFALPLLNSRPLSTNRSSVKVDELEKSFGDINLHTTKGSSSMSSTRPKTSSSRASTPKVHPKRKPLKAALRSCFSAAVTLTCPRSHPAFIHQKNYHAPFAPARSKVSTVVEQTRLPILPYTLPAVLPTWKVPSPEAEPVRRKKPTILSHGGKTRPGSPYPHQTISRMSSTSSLSSMASDRSQSSSRSTSSTFSTSTVESSELNTPAQSPTPDNAELIDDLRFNDDIFGDYFLHSYQVQDNFSFDINVEQPFDNDVSLSVAEFDKNICLSIAEFETTTLPNFEFFES